MPEFEQHPEWPAFFSGLWFCPQRSREPAENNAEKTAIEEEICQNRLTIYEVENFQSLQKILSSCWFSAL